MMSHDSSLHKFSWEAGSAALFPRYFNAKTCPAIVPRKAKMTDWKKAAAALDPPIPEPDVEKLLPVMNALEAAFRPLQRTLTPEDDVWTGSV